jgi:hypothetical protein
MNKMKFYVLTTRSINCLERHIHPDYSAIPKEDLIVVINTLDKEYEAEAKEWCSSRDIEHYVTDSNGTASRGKNSVLDLFLESDQDYFVMIDGDDYLTQHGVWMYKRIAEQDSPPDVICMKNQMALVWDRNLVDTWIKENNVDQNELKLGDIPEEYIKVKPNLIFTVNGEPETLNLLDSADGKVRKKELWNKVIAGLSSDRKISKGDRLEMLIYYAKQQKYCETFEAHCRVTWYSRKAAVHKFKEFLLVGEDTAQYFILKNESYHGRLEMFCNVEKPPTYIYDTSNPGVVCQVGEFGENNNKWLFPFNQEICNMEKQMLLHEDYSLPELEVDYPPDYVPEVFETTLNYLWDIEVDGEVVCQIEHPANCSAKSLEEKYNMIKNK